MSEANYPDNIHDFDHDPASPCYIPQIRTCNGCGRGKYEDDFIDDNWCRSCELTRQHADSMKVGD